MTRVNALTSDGVVHDARSWRTVSSACGLVLADGAWVSKFAVPPHVAIRFAITRDPVSCMACIGATRTPYAVLCDDHGQQFLTEEQYDRQMNRPDARWACPRCGEEAHWDDDHYEQAIGLQEQESACD